MHRTPRYSDLVYKPNNMISLPWCPTSYLYQLVPSKIALFLIERNCIRKDMYLSLIN